MVKEFKDYSFKERKSFLVNKPQAQHSQDAEILFTNLSNSFKFNLRKCMYSVCILQERRGVCWTSYNSLPKFSNSKPWREACIYRKHHLTFKISVKRQLVQGMHMGTTGCCKISSCAKHGRQAMKGDDRLPENGLLATCWPALLWVVRLEKIRFWFKVGARFRF